MYYFASDMHLGLRQGDPAAREKLLVQWLEEVSADAKAIYLMGDVFDFWFEYKRVVPKGFTRLLGKLSELTDRGVEIHIFTGNHDMWMYDYLEEECGVRVHDHSELHTLYGKKVYMGHGDNVKTGNKRIVRIMNRGFRSKWLRVLFSALIHPNAALKFGQWWSGESRKSHAGGHTFRGEKEPLVQFAEGYAKCIKVDYFVFGHIHIAKEYFLPDSGAKMFFLGEWITNPAYAVLSPDGEMSLRYYKKD